MATAAVHDAVEYTMDVAGDLATSAQGATRSVVNTVHNRVNRAVDEASPDDMVEIQDPEDSVTIQAPEDNTHRHQDGQRHPESNRHPVQQLWEDKHMVKEPTRWGVARHDVSFSGLGGVMFLLMLFSLVLLISSFASVGWITEPIDGEDGTPVWINKGLWEECTCTSNKHIHQPKYFTATQVLVTMGFVTSWAAMLCITLYMCLCLNVIKKTYLLFGLIMASAITVLLYFVGLVVFSAEEIMRLGWSFGLSIVGTFLCGLAAAFAVLQLRRSVHM